MCAMESPGIEFDTATLADEYLHASGYGKPLLFNYLHFFSFKLNYS